MNATVLILSLVAIALAAVAVTVWMHVSQQSNQVRTLRAREERFRNFFENAIEGVYEGSPEGVFLKANLAMARLLGYGSPAQTARIYVTPRRREEFYSALGRRDSLANFESEIRRPNGTTAWIKESVRVVRDAEGKIGYLQGFATDITERKRAVEALAASEERYRVLFENLPVAIVEYAMVPRWDGSNGCGRRASATWPRGWAITRTSSASSRHASPWSGPMPRPSPCSD
jgi:PAS domain S-box-containing protein